MVLGMTTSTFTFVHVVAQPVVLAVFVVLGIFAAKRFRNDPIRVAARAA